MSRDKFSREKSNKIVNPFNLSSNALNTRMNYNYMAHRCLIVKIILTHARLMHGVCNVYTAKYGK